MALTRNRRSGPKKDPKPYVSPTQTNPPPHLSLPPFVLETSPSLDVNGPEERRQRGEPWELTPRTPITHFGLDGTESRVESRHWNPFKEIEHLRVPSSKEKTFYPLLLWTEETSEPLSHKTPCTDIQSHRVSSQVTSYRRCHRKD